MPVTSQAVPAGQGLQFSEDFFFKALLKVPLGHGIGASTP
jgi:hypothetical protein